MPVCALCLISYTTIRSTYPHLKDLKTSNVEDSQEGGSLAFGLVQGLVDSAKDPTEQSLKHSFSQGFNSKVSLTNKHTHRKYYLSDEVDLNSDDKCSLNAVFVLLDCIMVSHSALPIVPALWSVPSVPPLCPL